MRVPEAPRVTVKIPEALRPTARAALLLFSIFAVGTIGYLLLGGSEHSVLDAIYMTTITLTTVGFGEVITVSHRPAAEIFTVVLLVAGTGTFVYFFSNLTAFVVEGTVERLFWRRRMTREINRLRDHYVVCGAGHTGEHVVRELSTTGRPFVLVDQNEERVRELHAKCAVEFPAVVGDATEDAVLVAAGLARASGLVACVSGDKDNILVTFTARNLNPGIRIVARCKDVQTEAKLSRAGADAVVSPDRIGGLRLVSEMVRPTVVSFLDVMLRDADQRWRVEEVTVGDGTELDGSTVGSLRDRGSRDLLVLALRGADGSWLYNPDPGHLLRSGTRIVFMGSPEARVMLDRAATSSSHPR
jgi:voltage-gated potassium channel